MSLKSRCWTVWDSCCGYRWPRVALWLPYDCDQRQPATQMNVAVLRKQHISVASWKNTTRNIHMNRFISLLCLKEASCSAPLLEQTRKLTHHALLKTVPYNSCHRKTRWVRWSVYHLRQQTSDKGQKEKPNSLRTISAIFAVQNQKKNPRVSSWTPVASHQLKCYQNKKKVRNLTFQTVHQRPDLAATQQVRSSLLTLLCWG